MRKNHNFSAQYNKAFLNNNKGSFLNIASNHGVMINKHIFEKYGYFYENFIYAGEDAELYRKFLAEGVRGEIVEQAKVIWDTPHNWNELKKQIKNYTIGNMQLYNPVSLVLAEKKSIVYLFLFLFLFLSLFFKLYSFAFVFLFFIFTINFCVLFKYGLYPVILKNYMVFYKVKVYFLYNRFLRISYRVNELNRYKGRFN